MSVLINRKGLAALNISMLIELEIIMKLIKASLLFSVVAGVSLLGASVTQAGLIAGGTAGTGTGVGGGLVGAVSITTGDEGGGDFTGAYGTNPNVVTMSLDVFELDSPFEVDFTVEDGTVGGINSTNYEFAVTVTNALTLGKEINGMDIELIVPGGVSVIFDIESPNAFASGAGSPLAFELPNLVDASSHIRFGGLNGGGGGIPFGGSQVLNFSIAATEIAQFSGESFSLRFTANPEPEAIMLGCFTLALGGFFVYRRRNQKVEIQAEAV